MIRLARAYLYVGLLVVLAFGGCATFGKAIATCEATTNQVDKILKALGSSTIPDIAIAAVDALNFGCATANEVDLFIAAHSTDASAAFMADGEPLDAVRLANAKAWRLKHPATKETSMIPSVGRIVHYQSYGTPGGEFLPEPRAAVVSEVNPAPNPGELVGLVVLNPTGLFFNRNVKHAENDVPAPGCWNWPPRA